MRHQPHARSVKCSIALPLRGSWRHVYSRTVTTTTKQLCSRRRVYSRAAAPAAAAADAPAAPAAYDALQQWLIEEKGALEQRVELTQVDEDQLGPRPACRATADIRAGQVVCRVPEDAAVTMVDAANHPAVGRLADGRGEVVSLALWLLAEREKPDSEWAPLLQALPETTETPILWDDKFRATELRGSPVLEQARVREEALRVEWALISAAIDSENKSREAGSSSGKSDSTAAAAAGADSETSPAEMLRQASGSAASAQSSTKSGASSDEAAAVDIRDGAGGDETATASSSGASSAQSSETQGGARAPVATEPFPAMTEHGFLQAVAVVLAHVVYLPTAECFALLPQVSFMGRTGNGDGCDVDYDAGRDFARGGEVCLNDDRPNGERLLATGSVQQNNASNYLLFETELVRTDRLYSSKREILQSMNIEDNEAFPLYIDRFPIQLLAFLRFSRIQDAMQLAQASFEKDVIISPLNEYETLQLVMGELRERLQAYLDGQEEDKKSLQARDLSVRQRLAIMQRLSEKDILQSTTDAIRARLAPIRGIPTKKGKLEDPNQDLLDIFETVEKGPQKLVSSIKRWASGADDPEFSKRK